MQKPAKPWYRKFNDTWYVQIDRRKIPLAKGKANKREAERAFYRLMAEGQVSAPEPSRLSVTYLCELFLDWCERHNAPRTYQWYRDFLQDFCDRYGSKTVADLKPLHVTQWLDAHPDWKTARRGAVIAVKRVFNWAVSEGRITENPLKAVKKPPVVTRDRILTPEERQQIYDNYPEGDPFRDFLTAMEETGARPGEIAAVTSEHIDLSAGVWVLQQHKTVRRMKVVRPRVIILTPKMIELTRKLMAKVPEGMPIFRNEDDEPWTRNAIRCRFRRIRKKLDLGPDLVAYLYRHTFTTDALENGVGVAQVAELLGHTTMETVLRHYNHLREKREHLREQAVKATQKKGEGPSLGQKAS